MQSAAGRVCKAFVMVVSIPIVARLAFADDPKICTMKPDGSECRTLVEMPGYDRVGSPAFSHDGKFIAFDGTRDNVENNHIFIMDAAGGPPRDIGLGARPTWSADDKQLCFLMLNGNPANEKTGVYVMNADGSGRQFVAPGGRGRWSPDGSRIAYMRRYEGVTTVWVYNMVNGENKPLLKENFATLNSSAWSPDGKQICIVGSREMNGDVELCIIDLDGDGKAVTKVKGQVILNSPCWAPGNKILFVMMGAGQSSPQPHWLDPNSPDPPTPIEFGRGKFWDPCWSPDMQQIVFRFVP